MSKIFLQNVTAIDHAYVNAEGFPIGGAFNLSVTLEGSTDNEEQVVLDFSTAKKRIKEAIDDSDTGIDHKLWVMNWGVIPPLPITGTFCEDAIVVFDFPYDVSNLESWISGFLTATLHGSGIMVRAHLDEKFVLPLNKGEAPHCSFRYTHGLAYSTSYGCQNIVHGHLSYIQAEMNHLDDIDYMAGEEVVFEISEFLHNKYLVNRSHVMNNGDLEDGRVLVQYKSRDRGFQEVVVDGDMVVILEDEPTIENIVKFIGVHFKEMLATSGIKSLYVSEGLSKGAVLKIEG